MRVITTLPLAALVFAALTARPAAATAPGAFEASGFGARCDGRTDDTVALQAALDRATDGGGVAGAVIVIPAGRCMISRALHAQLSPRKALSIRGGGMYVSEIVQTGDDDGLVLQFPGISREASRRDAASGPGISVRDLSMVQGAPPSGRHGGRAIALLGPDPKRFAVPNTADLLDRLDFRSAPGSAANWAADIFIRDVGNVRIGDGQIVHNDYGTGTERDIQLVSTSPPGQLTGNAISAIVISNENILGGNAGIWVEGNNIQGVFVLNSPMTAVGHAVHWDASRLGPGFDGPLVVHGSSISAQFDAIVTNAVDSLDISNNLIIDGQMIAGTDWCGICADGTAGAIVEGNILQNLPSTADLGQGHAGTGIRLASASGRYPSVVADNSIGTTDFGLVLAGPVAASNNIMMLSDAVPEACISDRTIAGMHPAASRNICGGQRDDRATHPLPDDRRSNESNANAPASSHSACATGQRAWDSRYEYRCVATNRWKRAALSDW